MRLLRTLLFLLWLPSGVTPAKAGGNTYCNPLDLDYQYNFEERERDISYRSGADPVLINHQGEYYLFSTITGGFWRSSNLCDWNHVRPEGWPERDMVAPAALSAKGKLYLMPSTFERCPIHELTSGTSLSLFNRLLPLLPGAGGPWDPALFHDEETDRWYLYFGSSNLYPLYGIELNFAEGLTYIDRPRELISLNPARNGWERFGPDHRYETRPFLEGAWMTKHRGKYYLQYAAPGTEHNVYANGTYVADAPLGPFRYLPNNPVSYKPGGFVTGAGHGNTFQDNHGNYWNTGTPWIGLNFDFERRIAMFPAGFDSDGLMFASTRFGDFPHRVAKGKWEHPDELFTGWMLLSYRKGATASSVKYPYGAANVTDENPRTFWLAGNNSRGERVTVDLGHACDVRAVQINFADYRSALFGPGPDIYTQFRLHHSLDGATWQVAADLGREKRDRPNAYVELESPVKARFIQYEHLHVGSPNLAISDIRVFGIGAGALPETPGQLRVLRDSDHRNATVTWSEVPGATGYNIRWGINAEKLYQTYQVFADAPRKLEIRALTIGQNYTFGIESFNERGVSQLSKTVQTE